jgi:hypothetical protein
MAAPCGDKKTDAAKRKGLGRAVEKYEKFRQKTVERIPRLDPEIQRLDSMYFGKAADHTAGRNQALAQLLSCLSLMRSLGDIARPQPVLKWSKAQVGAVHGTTDEPAAHCLPCQLWIDNAKPWDLVQSTLIDRKKLVQILQEEIFGHETILPLAFNLADTLSENNCLRGALVGACEYVIEHTKPQQRSGVLKRSGSGDILLTVADRPEAVNVGIDHQAVRDAYGVWQQLAAAAFAAAKDEADEGISHSGNDYTSDVLYILDKYEQSVETNVPPPRISDQWMWHFENDLWVPL